MPTPLPPNPFPPGAFHAAYRRCLALEGEASDLQTAKTCPAPIVCARLLGHLLRLAPAGNGQTQVQRGIALTVDNVELMKLAGNYLNLIVHACESQTVHYIWGSIHLLPLYRYVHSQTWRWTDASAVRTPLSPVFV